MIDRDTTVAATPPDFTEQARQLVEQWLNEPSVQAFIRFTKDDQQSELLCSAVVSLASEAATQGRSEDDYVAWCRYTHEGIDESGADIGTIVTCDSELKGAFKVYRTLSPDPAYLDRVRNEAATVERKRIKILVEKGIAYHFDDRGVKWAKL